MRFICALAMLFSLSGCYCVPDKGDPGIGQEGYFSGCWAEASKNKGN